MATTMAHAARLSCSTMRPGSTKTAALIMVIWVSLGDVAKARGPHLGGDEQIARLGSVEHLRSHAQAEGGFLGKGARRGRHGSPSRIPEAAATAALRAD